MSIDFRNPNSIWASVIVETVCRLGAKTAVVCPGSRSTPLTYALAQHLTLKAIPVLDERSASFFALGIALRSRIPTLLVCTSGTAAANFYPALIEARESRIPLLVLTADRPPEMRDCQSGQTIDQLKIYGSVPNWQAELAVPALDLSLLAYLRQTMMQAWERSLFPLPGPVHLNVPFRDPLAPLPDPQALAWQASLDAQTFFQAVAAPVARTVTAEIPLDKWLTCPQGIIVAGPAHPRIPEAYGRAVAKLSRRLGWPVLAEGLSPLRNHADLNPHLISTYDVLLRNQQWAAEMQPQQVIRLGSLPTSKELRAWLQKGHAREWVIDPADRNLDPLHGYTTHLPLSIETLVTVIAEEFPSAPTNYLDQWLKAEARIRSELDQSLGGLEWLFEGKIAWLLSHHLPKDINLFVANSTPVRDIETFWQPGNRRIRPYFSRGANGIDGTLSTALGISHDQSCGTVLLTGDLALLHDTNGFLIRPYLSTHLTIVLVNNRGGGIFETLPIAKFDPIFEEYFATPQQVNFESLCATYGVEHHRIRSWHHLQTLLDPLPTQGIRVLEVNTDRKIDAQWRHIQLARIAGQ